MFVHLEAASFVLIIVELAGGASVGAVILRRRRGGSLGSVGGRSS